MKKFISLFLSMIMLFSVVSFADVTSSEETELPLLKLEYPLVIDNTTIDKKPQTVGTISPAVTDIIKGLGFENRITAVGNGSVKPIFADPRDAYTIYEIGSLYEPNLENLKKSAPDILFTHAPFTETNKKRIESMGIKIVEIPYAENFDDVFENYRLICKVMLGEYTGNIYADKKISRYKEILKMVSDISLKNSEEKSAIYIDMYPKTLATGETFQNIILKEILAFENPAEESTNWTLTDEGMKELNPDKIFYNCNINPEEIKSYISYSTTNAITEDQLYVLKGKYFQSKSPQMFMNLVSLMYELYPNEMPKDLSEI